MMLAFIHYDMKKEILKTMKILPIDLISPFEWNSNPQQIVRIDEIQQIRHPFLVTPISGGKYLLLEESAEFYMFKDAGITQLPVQIIQNNQVVIKQDSIGVYSFDQNDFNDILTSNVGHITSEVTNAQEVESSAVHLYYDNKKFLLKTNLEISKGCSLVITKIFNYFEKNGGYRMIKHSGSLSESLMKIHRFEATLELPIVTFETISNAVEEDNLFPPDVFHMSSDIRMLYIDFPVTTLVSEDSIFDKEVFLRELILLREQTEKTSIYQGKVYLLNR